MITEAQRQARQKYIGSSDCAAICGLDPYRSPADVWLEKTGQAAPFEGNEHTDRGNLLEPVLLDWVEQQLGLKFHRGVMAVADDGILAANFDGIGAGFLAEAKSASSDLEWGDPGTDQVPDRVVCQSHHQFYVAGPEFRVCWVPLIVPMFRRFDFRLYRVDRNDDLAERLADQCRTFKTKFIDAGTKPDDFRPSLETLKRVRREPGKSIELPADVAARWLAVKEHASAVEKAKKEAEKELLAALGDAEAGTFNGGQITYLETQRKAYTVEASSYRQLRVKKH